MGKCCHTMYAACCVPLEAGVRCLFRFGSDRALTPWGVTECCRGGLIRGNSTRLTLIVEDRFGYVEPSYHNIVGPELECCTVDISCAPITVTAPKIVSAACR